MSDVKSLHDPNRHVCACLYVSHMRPTNKHLYNPMKMKAAPH